MAQYSYLLIVFAWCALTSTARAETAEKKQGEGSVYALLGVQNGSGTLLQPISAPSFELGISTKGTPGSADWTASLDVFVASSRGSANVDQKSYQPDTRLSLRSVGFSPAVCYVNAYVDVCPLGILQTINVTEANNQFAFWSLGYGLELDKAVGPYRYIVKATEATFAHKIDGKVESGKLRTVQFGLGVVLGAK